MPVPAEKNQRMKIKRVIKRFWHSSPSDLLACLKGEKGRVRTSPGEGSGRFVWCLSTGRAGTKTLAALGGVQNRVNAQHEPEPLLYGLGRLAYAQQEHEESRKILREALATCRSTIRVPPGGVYLETSPQVTFLAHQFREMFPGSRFIHIIRHPGSVIRSGMRRGWYAGHNYDRWRITPRTGTGASDSWERWSTLEKNAWLWAETNRWISSFLDTLPPQERVVIRSEDLFRGDEEAVRKFYGQLDVAVPPGQELEKVLGKMLNRQESGDFPEWQDWSEEQLAEVGPHIEELMARYSYSFHGSE